MTEVKFKVGDKVRVVGNDYKLRHFHDTGSVGIVVDGGVGYPHVVEDKVLVEVDGFEQTVLATDLELAEDVGKDNVNHPSHYNESGIECIEAIRATLGDEFPAYCKGNVMKYLWRYKYKNGIEDLKKAQVYLNWMVEYIEDNEGE